MENHKLARLALSSNGFLFDATTGHTYTLNRSATLILKSLIEGNPAERVTEQLAERFEVSSEAAARDVEQFLARLFSLGLMRE